MPYQGFRILDVEWADLKTYKTRDVFTLYYVAGPGNASYEIIGISDKFIYRSKLILDADISDFTTNFLSAAISKPSIDNAIGDANTYDTGSVNSLNGEITSTVLNGSVALDVNIVNAPSIPASQMVWVESRAATAGQTKTLVASYTVPTGKSFYIIIYSLNRITSNTTGGTALLEIDNGGTLTEKDAFGMPGGTSGNSAWQQNITIGAAYIATAGEIIKISITPSSSQNTEWGAKIIGILK